MSEKIQTLDAEKQISAHQKYSSDILDKKTNGDYSGATAKTDPEEIKLVKKLDLWIMVRGTPYQPTSKYQILKL